MTVKYHISPTTGNPNRCYAEKKPCPLGGPEEHYPSKEAAQQAFEKDHESEKLTSMKKSTKASITSIGGVSITPEMESSYKEAYSKATHLATPSLSKAEQKILEDVGMGKKVSDEKLDKIIDRLRHANQATPYQKGEAVKQGEAVLQYLKAVRRQSPTPSTLQDAFAFDPATQSMFSNADARRHPAIAGKAMTRTSKHMEWMQELADSDRVAAQDNTLTSEERQEYLNSAAQREDEALRAEARLQAQLKEMQYQYDNDEEFRSNLKLSIVRYLKDGFYREPNSKYRGVPLEGIRKA